ncbi:helix-turn-helix domain-containing protein [Providencia sp.]|uniref:helix-turn-helix domain-containing protein n=1 Tax=Providencia sp. TaxID=589 RepID=UPI000E89E64C|nr:helix-turn-helix transcriptional regulator [Providencia sp.]MBP6081775.1 helix-turn-helix transcriptional regulator [Providencia sp.]HBO23475.1 XRE family transcriptional regulator [Providencia sp.]
MRENYPLSKIVGNNILYYRKMKGVPLRLISKEIGISAQQQSRYERGINRINLERLAQYVKYLKLNYIDLLTINDKP